MEKIKTLRAPKATNKRVPLSCRPWYRTRDYALAQRRKIASSKDESLCEHCAALGEPYKHTQVECHHIIPRRIRPDLTHSLSNLQFLCKEHHSLRTMLESVEKTGVVIVIGRGNHPGAITISNPTEAYREAIRLGATVIERNES